MSDFAKDLEAQLKNVLPAKKSTKVVKNMNANNNNLAFGIIILMLVAGCYFAYTYKAKTSVLPNPQTNWQNMSSSTYPNISQPQPWANTDNTAAEIEALKRRYDAIYGATAEIWNRTKWNTERMTLLATLNNHNLVVIQQNLPKTELILLNDDWTINRMPDRIRLDAADQEFMRKFIRR